MRDSINDRLTSSVPKTVEPSPVVEKTKVVEVNDLEPNSATLKGDTITVGKSFLIMKTVNDREFDVSLIHKFNKNDYKKTKICRESLKPIIKALE